MTTLSITMPDKLADASCAAAKYLGISRTEFIRQAITHELNHIQAQKEREAIIQSIKAMKKNKAYLQDSEELDNSFNSTLPIEDKEWWIKKS